LLPSNLSFASFSPLLRSPCPGKDAASSFMDGIKTPVNRCKPARCERTDVRKLGEDASTLSDLRQRSDKRRSNKPMGDWKLGGNKLSWSAKSYTNKASHLRLATMRARNPILWRTMGERAHTSPKDRACRVPVRRICTVGLFLNGGRKRNLRHHPTSSGRNSSKALCETTT